MSSGSDRKKSQRKAAVLGVAALDLLITQMKLYRDKAASNLDAEESRQAEVMGCLISLRQKDDPAFAQRVAACQAQLIKALSGITGSVIPCGIAASNFQ
jgi:hypothetical protein